MGKDASLPFQCIQQLIFQSVNSRVLPQLSLSTILIYRILSAWSSVNVRILGGVLTTKRQEKSNSFTCSAFVTRYYIVFLRDEIEGALISEISIKEGH